MKDIAEIYEHVQPHDEHGFLLPTKAVAVGYGVGDSTIRRHKMERPSELIEGQHWIKIDGSTMWTARGVIQLGFCTQSRQGEEFRRWAENQIMGERGVVSLAHASLPPADELGKALAQEIHQQSHAAGEYEAQVNQAVELELQRLQESSRVALGKSLGLRWGVLPERIQALMQQPVEVSP